MSSELDQRYYFALRPEAELARKLTVLSEDIVRRGGGRVIAPEQLHVTLAHLGALKPNKLAEVRKAASELAFERVELELTRVEHWPEVKLATLVCDRRPEALLGFVRSLHAALKKLHLSNYDFEYHPHVSLAQGVERDVATALRRPIYWRADHFVLVQTQLGVEAATHEIVDAWEGGWTREACLELSSW